MAVGPADPAAHAPKGGQVGQGPRRRRSALDLLAGVLLLAGATLAIATLPPGSAWRLGVTLPALLLVPGYFLVEAVAEPAVGLQQRLRRIAFALGLSPGLVGLLALGTAALPGAFRPLPILTLILVTCLGLGMAAFWRRRSHAQRVQAEPVVA